ncbi:NXPE family member 3-like isoform X1 [Herpailurus yagouaroundi]|uniref:NXPE family member 3-like isoform X1 n=1 Tax=Herpailurus yagouaroundi TaxID=1608482 RepID=UPI001AD6EDAA|nr:NXPE family member 3-like isoform X1 [Puma yagouaroundi]
MNRCSWEESTLTLSELLDHNCSKGVLKLLHWTLELLQKSSHPWVLITHQMSSKQLQASTDLFIRPFRWHMIVTVGSVIAICILYIRVSWPNSMVPLPPQPRPACKSSGCLPKELSDLTHLLHWPPTPGDAGDLLASTSPQTSTYHLRDHSQASYTLGGSLEAILVARDHQGRPKTCGGDLFRAQLLGPHLKAGVPGDIQDLENGTYLLSFPLLWAGQAQVRVQLIHSSEALRVLRGIWRDQWATVDFMGYFRGPTGYEEIVTCNVNPLLTGEEESTCHYKDEDSGELWFCARPPTLPCNSLVGHSSGHYWNMTTPHEEALLACPEAYGSTHHILDGAPDGGGDRSGHSAALVGPQLAPALPALTSGLPALCGLGTGGPGRGPPHSGGAGPGRPLHHLSPSVFVQRLAGIRAAVAALLAREPRTVVVIKLANTGYKSVYGSDWFTLQVNRLLRAAFADLRVAFVDAWEMTSSLALPDRIHPGQLIVRNEVNFLLSFICPI